MNEFNDEAERVLKLGREHLTKMRDADSTEWDAMLGSDDVVATLCALHYGTTEMYPILQVVPATLMRDVISLAFTCGLYFAGLEGNDARAKFEDFLGDVRIDL